jgi:hypothetical protein
MLHVNGLQSLQLKKKKKKIGTAKEIENLEL